MSETLDPTPSAIADLQARLQAIASELRETDTLNEDSQEALAELVEELNNVLATAQVPPAEVTHLAQTTAHLAESLHAQQGTGPLSRARAALERAVTNAEAHSPTVVGLARRLLQTLADIGI